MNPSPLSRRGFLAAAAGTAAFATAGSAFFPPSASAAIPGPGSYTAAWSSVDQHPPSPEWFQDAKFGIYYHWGVFSVPAYGNEWYPRRMYISGDDCNTHHKNVFGDPSDWPYNNFIDGAADKAGNFTLFAPKLKSAGGNFDPDEWAQLFVDAGAKFAGPVAEHHDGFSMWNSTANEWNSVGKGPHLNLLELHTNAIRAKGLKLLVAMHHAYHFTGYYDHVPAQTNPSLQKLYGQLGSTAENQLWYDKLKEVIDQAHPDILWQDFNLPAVDETQRLNFLSYYYNQAVSWGNEVVATFKDGFDNLGEVYDYERGGPAELTSPSWLTDDSISSSSWCYTVGIGYYSITQMLHALIDRVSKNGNMLLNIAPMADGTIPQGQKDVLLGIGDYLKRFGKSIYSTRAWTVYGEGPTKMGGGSFVAPVVGTAQDLRFTRSKDNHTLFATVLGWPGTSLNITTLASSRINLSTLSSVQLLGSTAGSYTNLPTRTQDGTGLHVTLPSSSAPFSAPAYVLKLVFSGAIPEVSGGPGSSPLPAGITAYTDVNFSGTAVTLALGSYTAAELQSAGLPALSISSFAVAAGYRVVAYSGDSLTGTSWTFTTDASDLRNSRNNDVITSLKVTLNPATYLRMTNVSNGLVLDGGGLVAAGSLLKQWTWDGSFNLQWQIEDQGNGYYRLVNRTNGLVADGNGLTANGSNVPQAVWTGSNSQQWAISHQGNGRFWVANRSTGLIIDSGGQTSVGSLVVQWTPNANTNTMWTFTTT